MELYGFSYRNSASFRNPDMEISGRVAIVLLTQQRTINRLHGVITKRDRNAD
jgi:hypothetical protein